MQAERALGTAVGEARTERGPAVLLNFHVTQYIGEREMKKGKAQRDLFQAFTGALGLKPRLARTDGAGGELIRTETITWTKGNVTLYALYRDGGPTGPAEIACLEKRHVFDLRTGAKGEVDRFKIDALKPGYAHFFAAYPYDPGQPAVQTEKATVSRGDNAAFTIRMAGVPKDEQGVFSFETRLLNPSGEWVDVIPWSVQSVGGTATVRFRAAYNDPPGQWTLSVREITTGRKAECKFEVR